MRRVRISRQDIRLVRTPKPWQHTPIAFSQFLGRKRSAAQESEIPRIGRGCLTESIRGLLEGPIRDAEAEPKQSKNPSLASKKPKFWISGSLLRQGFCRRQGSTVAKAVADTSPGRPGFGF